MFPSLLVWVISLWIGSTAAPVPALTAVPATTLLSRVADTTLSSPADLVPTSASFDTTTPSTSSGGGLSGAAIGGIVAAALVILLLFGFLIYRSRNSSVLSGSLKPFPQTHHDPYLPRYTGPSPAGRQMAGTVNFPPAAYGIRPGSGYYGSAPPQPQPQQFYQAHARPGVSFGEVGVRRI
ncbi:hypothetical protein P7C73_g4038, partial [Tremellales sp. Uapishka_1]